MKLQHIIIMGSVSISINCLEGILQIKFSEDTGPDFSNNVRHKYELFNEYQFKF